MPKPQVIIVIIAVLVIVSGGICLFLQRSQGTLPPSETALPPPATPVSEQGGLDLNMKIESPVFLDGQSIPARYTCDGENVNPALNISEVPEGTKCLVLIVDDPDAPVGTWVHWTAWNIAPQTTEIRENSVPEGAIEGVTGFGRPGYGGPCPPSGTHRYFFKLYALDMTLGLDGSAKAGDIEDLMEGHVLGQAQLMGLYRR